MLDRYVQDNLLSREHVDALTHDQKINLNSKVIRELFEGGCLTYEEARDLKLKDYFIFKNNEETRERFKRGELLLKLLEYPNIQKYVDDGFLKPKDIDGLKLEQKLNLNSKAIRELFEGKYLTYEEARDLKMGCSYALGNFKETREKFKRGELLLELVGYPNIQKYVDDGFLKPKDINGLKLQQIFNLDSNVVRELFEGGYLTYEKARDLKADHLSAFEKNKETREQFKRGELLLSTDKFGLSGFFIRSCPEIVQREQFFRAIAEGNFEKVSELVSKGMDLTVKNKQGMSPLEWARKQQQPYLVQYFLERKKKFKSENALKTLLAAAYKIEFMVALENMLMLSVNQNGLILDELSVHLCLSRLNEDFDIPDIEGVLRKVNNEGYSLIYNAAIDLKPFPKIGALIEKISGELREEWMKVVNAVIAEQTVIALRKVVIQQAGRYMEAGFFAPPSERIAYVPSITVMDAVKRLVIICKVDVNQRDAGGNALLHYALENSKLDNVFKDLAEFLIANGADVNAKNMWGVTPLEVERKTSYISCGYRR